MVETKERKKTYTYEEVYKDTLYYFGGEELPTGVWINKYCLKDNNGNYIEKNPDDMHRRLSKEFARIEENYIKSEDISVTTVNKLSPYGYNRTQLDEEGIFNLFKNFKYIIPQGSIMSQLGAKSIGSLSNCFFINSPYDSYGGIFKKDEELAQLMKRRAGVGIDISTLRPSETPVSNAAISSTGAVSFMHRFSNTTREVAQSGRRGK